MLRDNSKQEINRALLDLKRKAILGIQANYNVSVAINYYSIQAETYYNKIVDNISQLAYYDEFIHRLQEGLNISKAELVAKYNGAWELVRDARARWNSLNESLSSKNKEVKQARADWESARNDYNNWIRNTYTPSVNSHNARIAEYESEIADLRSEISRLNTELNSLISNRDTMRSQLDYLYTNLFVQIIYNGILNLGNPPPTISQSHQWISPVGFTYNGIYYAPGSHTVLITRSYDPYHNVNTRFYEIRVTLDGNVLYEDKRNCWFNEANAAQKVSAAASWEDFITSYREQAEEVYDNLDQEIDSIRNEIMADEETMYDYYDYIGEERDAIADLDDEKSDRSDVVDEFEEVYRELVDQATAIRKDLDEQTKSINSRVNALNKVKAEVDVWNDSYYGTEYEITSDDCPGYDYTPSSDDEDDDE